MWIAIGIIVLALIVFVAVRIIRAVAKMDKAGEKLASKTPDALVPEQEYVPQDAELQPKLEQTDTPKQQVKQEPVSISDDLDDDFLDYNNHMRNRKISNFDPDEFMDQSDIEDDLPQLTEEDYMNLERLKGPAKKKKLSAELNELPTELKVLMLSDIFDRLF